MMGSLKVKQIGNCTIYNADCLKIMSQYPDNHFNLAIVDPPYFSIKKIDYSHGRQKSANGHKFNKYKSFKKWDVPNNDYYNEVCRVSKNQIIWGINYYNFQNVPVGRIVWDKKRYANTQFSDGEIASCSLITGVKFFRYLWHGFLQEDMKNKEVKIHPTQKPIALYKFLLENFAKQGDLILDTHFGSGSIGIACNLMGFELTACEIDIGYFNAACKRIAGAENK